MVCWMIATVSVGYVSETPQFGDQVGALRDVPLFDFRQIIVSIQTAVFSTAFQFAVPVVASIARNKKMIKPIFRRAVSFVFISNLVLSILLAIYFGSQIADPSNTNWIDYHEGVSDESRAGWATFISQYIVIFAAVDGACVFPLIAISISEILLDFFYHSNDKAIEEIEHDWKRRIVFRLLASVPQTVGALFVNDLKFLSVYAGIFTLLSYTVLPLLLLIESRKRMEKEGLPVTTYYTLHYLATSDIAAWVLIALASLVAVGIIASQATGVIE